MRLHPARAGGSCSVQRGCCCPEINRSRSIHGWISVHCLGAAHSLLYQSLTELLILYRIHFEFLLSELQQVFAFPSLMKTQGMSAQCTWCPIPVLGVLCPAWCCSLFTEFTSHVPVGRVSKGTKQPSSVLGWRRRTWEDDSCKAIHHQAWAVSIRSYSLCLLPKLLWGHPTVLDKTPNRQILPSLQHCGILTNELYKPCKPAHPRLLPCGCQRMWRKAAVGRAFAGAQKKDLDLLIREN